MKYRINRVKLLGFGGLTFAAILLLNSCASTNSHVGASGKSEEFKVRTITPSKTTPQKLTGAELLLAGAYQVGDLAVKKLIDWEAGKYSQSSKDSVVMKKSLLQIDVKKGFDFPQFILVTRSYEKGSLAGVSKVSAYEVSSNYAIDPYKFSKDRDLSFAAVLAIVPETGGSHYSVQLCAYAYPFLKAKNLTPRVPFTKWHETESVLSVSLTGAQGGADRYKAEGSIRVPWNRQKPTSDWQKPKGGKPKIIFYGKKTSETHLTLKCSLIESNDLTKTIGSLKDSVDVKDWIGGE